MSKTKKPVVTPSEAAEYLARRRGRPSKYDWESILRRVLDGERQSDIARDVGASQAVLSLGLRRYAKRLAQEAK